MKRRGRTQYTMNFRLTLGDTALNNFTQIKTSARDVLCLVDIFVLNRLEITCEFSQTTVHQLPEPSVIGTCRLDNVLFSKSQPDAKTLLMATCSNLSILYPIFFFHRHEFLNAFAGAFITDRTLVWDICRRKHCRLDNEEDCALHLTRMPWIPSLADIQSLWSKKKCTGPGPSSMSHLFTVPQIYHGFTKDILMYCCIDQLRESFVEFGALQLREMFSVSVQSSCLGAAARLRANILFQFGEHYGYGALFRSAFVFNPAIIENNDNIMRGMISSYSSAPNTSNSISSNSSAEGERTTPFSPTAVLYIGLHLRHSNDDDLFANGTNYGEFDCIRSKIADFLGDSRTWVDWL